MCSWARNNISWCIILIIRICAVHGIIRGKTNIWRCHITRYISTQENIPQSMLRDLEARFRSYTAYKRYSVGTPESVCMYVRTSANPSFWFKTNERFCVCAADSNQICEPPSSSLGFKHAANNGLYTRTNLLFNNWSGDGNKKKKQIVDSTAVPYATWRLSETGWQQCTLVLFTSHSSEDKKMQKKDGMQCEWCCVAWIPQTSTTFFLL
jgi:hypothetical protein